MVTTLGMLQSIDDWLILVIGVRTSSHHQPASLGPFFCDHGWTERSSPLSRTEGFAPWRVGAKRVAEARAKSGWSPGCKEILNQQRDRNDMELYNLYNDNINNEVFHVV